MTSNILKCQLVTIMMMTPLGLEILVWHSAGATSHAAVYLHGLRLFSVRFLIRFKFHYTVVRTRTQ